MVVATIITGGAVVIVALICVHDTIDTFIKCRYSLLEKQEDNSHQLARMEQQHMLQGK